MIDTGMSLKSGVIYSFAVAVYPDIAKYDVAIRDDVTTPGPKWDTGPVIQPSGRRPLPNPRGNCGDRRRIRPRDGLGRAQQAPVGVVREQLAQ